MKLTKKQKKINKKERHMKSKSYAKKQKKKELNKQDKEWKEKVKLKDNYKCAICGKESEKGRGKALHVHHIIPREIKELRHDPKNGITLCARHHKYNYALSAHKNSLSFFIWMEKNRIEQLEYLKKIIEDMELYNVID